MGRTERCREVPDLEVITPMEDWSVWSGGRGGGGKGTGGGYKSKIGNGVWEGPEGCDGRRMECNHRSVSKCKKVLPWTGGTKEVSLLPTQNLADSDLVEGEGCSNR